VLVIVIRVVIAVVKTIVCVIVRVAVAIDVLPMGILSECDIMHVVISVKVTDIVGNAVRIVNVTLVIFTIVGTARRFDHAIVIVIVIVIVFVIVLVSVIVIGVAITSYSDCYCFHDLGSYCYSYCDL